MSEQRSQGKSQHILPSKAEMGTENQTSKIRKDGKRRIL